MTAVLWRDMSWKSNSLHTPPPPPPAHPHSPPRCIKRTHYSCINTELSEHNCWLQPSTLFSISSAVNSSMFLCRTHEVRTQAAEQGHTVPHRRFITQSHINSVWILPIYHSLSLTHTHTHTYAQILWKDWHLRMTLPVSRLTPEFISYCLDGREVVTLLSARQKLKRKGGGSPASLVHEGSAPKHPKLTSLTQDGRACGGNTEVKQQLIRKTSSKEREAARSFWDVFIQKKCLDVTVFLPFWVLYIDLHLSY